MRNENEIPLFREFPLSGTTNKPFSQYLSGIRLLVSGTILEEALSPGQTDSQVVASSGKLNLRRDLRWMAKRTGKFPRKCTKVAKKNAISRLRAQSLNSR